MTMTAAVCDRCGAYAATAIGCRACGAPDATRVQPVFLLTGASGVGKTSLVGPLQDRLPSVNVFDTDALLEVPDHWEAWLRVAHGAAQAGRAILLCGTVLPEWLDPLPPRLLVGDLHVGLLHCDDATRAARLFDRPAWRGCDEAFVEEHRAFAATLLERGWPVFDTSLDDARATATKVSAWVESCMASIGPEVAAGPRWGA